MKTTATASADFHFVPDAGEETDFLHVLGPEDDAVGGAVFRSSAATDLESGLGNLDNFIRSAVVFRLDRDLAAVEFGELGADLGFSGRKLAGDAEVKDGIFANEFTAVPDGNRVTMWLEE